MLADFVLHKVRIPAFADNSTMTEVRMPSLNWEQFYSRYKTYLRRRCGHMVRHRQVWTNKNHRSSTRMGFSFREQGTGKRTSIQSRSLRSETDVR
jgi:hypothetical protein